MKPYKKRFIAGAAMVLCLVTFSVYAASIFWIEDDSQTEVFGIDDQGDLDLDGAGGRGGGLPARDGCSREYEQGQLEHRQQDVGPLAGEHDYFDRLFTITGR